MGVILTSMILGLKRTCAECGKDQTVPKSKDSDRIKCKYCGADLPAEP